MIIPAKKGEVWVAKDGLGWDEFTIIEDRKYIVEYRCKNGALGGCSRDAFYEFYENKNKQMDMFEDLV